jgi:hypothetical protein
LYHLSFSFDLYIIKKRTDDIRPTEKDKRYKGQRKRTDDTKTKIKGQMIQRPKEKGR